MPTSARTQTAPFIPHTTCVVRSTVASLVKHHANQSAAAAAGAVPLLVQLTKSSNAALQQAAVNTLARFEQGPTEPPSAAA